MRHRWSEGVGKAGEVADRLGVRIQLAVGRAGEAGPKQFNPSAKCTLAPTADTVQEAGMST